ncbi:hypothetical protein D9757_003490 [Collybiopsis confluens]|uniref:Rho termination factor N-terminal domain-containing protein n=1 Tax=Collybiopsis confluens TaxID=2823264 RepID=A0A8H5HTF9_9AGAR|nr:hypothetical protein D9757_003490 [Collybiopsis confluens]
MYTLEELQKWTVNRLKAFCKDKKISGYSKLSKPSLIQKILDSTPPAPKNAPTASTLQVSGLPLSETARTTTSALITKTTSTLKRSGGNDSEPTIPRPSPSKKARKSSYIASTTEKASETSTSTFASVTTAISSSDDPEPSPSDGRASKRPPSSAITLRPTPEKMLKRVETAVAATISGSQARAVSNPLTLLLMSKPKKPEQEVPTEVQKKMLEGDPLASNIQDSSVTCKGCGSVVKFTLFDISLWRAHKECCPSEKSAPIHTHKDSNTRSTKKKRFNPLIIHKPALSSTAPTSAVPSVSSKIPSQGALLMTRKASSVPDITLEVNSSSCLSLYHLDFSPSVPIALKRISMPPSLVQRKQVARFAIILSQVAVQDLLTCALVSKMFRYAIYLSASARLARNFAGDRLKRILHRLQVNMIDMWPYLLQREGETKYRRRIFEESFLGRVFSGRTVIAPRLWTSPDNYKQVVIAIRLVQFSGDDILTQTLCLVSIGGGENNNGWLDGVIVDAQEIIKQEIWSVDVLQASKTAVETFYVLEATCEVVGFVSQIKGKERAPIHLRADWSTYIQRKLSTSSQLNPEKQPPLNTTTSLLEQLSWTNHEEYIKGISKLWLKRIEVQQAVGEAKKSVAERYVLASVVANRYEVSLLTPNHDKDRNRVHFFSVSGQYKTSTEMANDFAGLPVGSVGSAKKAPGKLNLFLPHHHHVESAHFTTPQGKPLHPALAVVHTPARDYYVLRDNGMQVGCEEEGIGCTWMQIIGCTADGERA